MEDGPKRPRSKIALLPPPARGAKCHFCEGLHKALGFEPPCDKAERRRVRRNGGTCRGLKIKMDD